MACRVFERRGLAVAGRAPPASSTAGVLPPGLMLARRVEVTLGELLTGDELGEVVLHVSVMRELGRRGAGSIASTAVLTPTEAGRDCARCRSGRQSRPVRVALLAGDPRSSEIATRQRLPLFAGLHLSASDVGLYRWVFRLFRDVPYPKPSPLREEVSFGGIRAPSR